MQVNNVIIHRDMPFDDYLKLEGISYSTISAKWAAGANPAPTQKMQIGTLVHNYLLEPSKYIHNNPHHKQIVIMAREVKSILGAAFDGFECEVGVTADFFHEGFTMAYKGRIDMVKLGRIVLDLKVSEVPLNQSVPYFGYDRQLSGYSLATDARLQMIIKINPKTNKIEFKQLPISADWWQTQVLKYGKVL